MPSLSLSALLGELEVDLAAGCDGSPRLFEEARGRLPIALGELAIAALVVEILGERAARLLRVELERMLALGRATGVVAIERPVPGLDGELLLLHALRHVDAVGDAVGVGDHQRRTIVRL